MTVPLTLADVEAAHGFVFGGPAETGPGQPVAAVVCNAPTCNRRGQHFQVHDDTMLPVHCGGCQAVLHEQSCDHKWEPQEMRGDETDPYDRTFNECALCGATKDEAERELTGEEIVARMPLGRRKAFEYAVSRHS